MFKCQIVHEALDIQKASSLVEDSNFGAEIVFVGRVRAINHGKIVTAVAYDAFIPLAEKCFYEICEQTKNLFADDMKISVFHRVGRLEIGEASVVIAVGTKHRELAYKVSKLVLEEIKVRAPIWKKEFYLSGETEWLQGHALCGTNHSHLKDV